MIKAKETDEMEGLDFFSVSGDGNPEAPDTDLLLPIHGTEEETLDKLRRCATSLNEEKCAFKPGDIIQWKRNMRNKRHPDYGTPMIVLEVMEPPISNIERESGSAYFREILTIKAGSLDSDADFVVFHYDGRRFESYGI